MGRTPDTSTIVAVAAPFLRDEGVRAYDNLDSLLAVDLDEPPMAVVLGRNALTVDNLVRLRREPALAFVPVYLDGESGSDWDAATDGVWPGTAQALETAEKLRSQLEKYLGDRLPETQDERLLSYFRLRPDARLVPFVDRYSDALYRYPLLEAYSDGGDVEVWLGAVRQRGWLEKTEVVDRIRQCRRCDSGHLNFVDICPECDALDIEASESLHCFLCGHVGRRDLFIRDGVMVCPNCYSRLRHIGVDYDRPLETHACNRCMAAFIEPQVVARCLACGHKDDPSDLNVATVARFRLNPQTRLLAASGLTADWSSSISGLRLLPTALFANILDWQIDVACRYGSHQFSLVGVNLGDLGSLVERIGEGRALQLLDSFSERLQELLRASDLVGRTLDNQLWLLLPATPADKLPIIIERLRALEQLTGAELDLALSITSATIPEQLQEGEDAQLLMARLGEEAN